MSESEATISDQDTDTLEELVSGQWLIFKLYLLYILTALFVPIVTLLLMGVIYYLFSSVWSAPIPVLTYGNLKISAIKFLILVGFANLAKSLYALNANGWPRVEIRGEDTDDDGN